MRSIRATLRLRRVRRRIGRVLDPLPHVLGVVSCGMTPGAGRSRILIVAAAAIACLGASAVAGEAARVSAGDRFRKPPPVRAEQRQALQERRLSEAQRALERGRIKEARELLKGVDAAQLSRVRGEEAAYLAASIAEDAATADRLLDEYLK